MDTLPQSWQASLQLGLADTISQFLTFLPRLLGSILIFLIGLVLARILRSVVVRTLEALRVSKVVEKTPLEHFLQNAEADQKIESIVGAILYWLFLFLVLHASVSVLGLTPISEFMDKILSYVPHIFSALFIFLFGVLLAGLAESVAKGALRNIDVSSSRLVAKMVSYAVVSFAVLAAIAELGIASEFIKILFFGVVTAFALGTGLAVGLGGQHTVKKIMDDWYQRTRE